MEWDLSIMPQDPSLLKPTYWRRSAEAVKLHEVDALRTFGD